MWLLGRILSMMMVPEDDDYWQNFLVMMEIAS